MEIPVKKINRRSQCPSDERDISEIKTSILTQLIINNRPMNDGMVRFLKTISVKIAINIDKIANVLESQYLDVLRNPNDAIVNQYPVAQSRAWVNNSNRVDDAYFFLNYVKWLWAKIRESIPRDNIIVLLMNNLQQKIFMAHQYIRGPRADITTTFTNSQVGITHIKIPFLERSLSRNDTPIIPWIHPGENTCRTSYQGVYGRTIQEYENNDNLKKYSSLKCGISASTNYFLYMYLYSIIDGVRQENDIKYVFTFGYLLPIT